MYVYVQNLTQFTANLLEIEHNYKYSINIHCTHTNKTNKCKIQNGWTNIIFYRSRSLGSAAIMLCYLAMGAIDICSLEYLKCWDVAAGILIIQESGGIVLDLNGKNNFFINI